MGLEFQFDLGAKVQDMFTGFEGKVIGQLRTLGGIQRYSVQPEKLKADGGTVDAEWFDEVRLAKVQREGPEPSNFKVCQSGRVRMEAHSAFFMQ